VTQAPDRPAPRAKGHQHAYHEETGGAEEGAPAEGLRAAIITVLADAKEPMTAREIWDEIKRRRLHKSTGATPWATVAATCYTHDEFERADKGKFALKVK
jgi:HB1, ASXL, restriction endonuclease HTH domain